MERIVINEMQKVPARFEIFRDGAASRVFNLQDTRPFLKWAGAEISREAENYFYLVRFPEGWTMRTKESSTYSYRAFYDSMGKRRITVEERRQGDSTHFLVLAHYRKTGAR